MRNFKNNYKRGRFRSNSDRNFKRNGVHKHNQDFTNGSDFQRKSPGRNNQNASKLINKYIDLAREALSNGDKILSENYFQHADHFTRILNEQEIYKKRRFTNNTTEEKNDDKSEVVNIDNKKIENEEVVADNEITASNN